MFEDDDDDEDFPEPKKRKGRSKPTQADPNNPFDEEHINPDDPQLPAAKGFCEFPGCYVWDDVAIWQGQTSYPWEAGQDNPNRDRRYCQAHGKAYTDYWHARWGQHFFQRPNKFGILPEYERNWKKD